jgi:hypothetical protein
MVTPTYQLHSSGKMYLKKGNNYTVFEYDPNEQSSMDTIQTKLSTGWSSIDENTYNRSRFAKAVNLALGTMSRDKIDAIQNLAKENYGGTINSWEDAYARLYDNESLRGQVLGYGISYSPTAYHQTGEWKSYDQVPNVALGVTQLSDAERNAAVEAGNAAYTAETGGFKPSDPAALAAAGTMTSETVKPEFQAYDPKTGETLTGQRAYDRLQGEPTADLLSGKISIPDLVTESDKMNTADAVKASAQYYGKSRVQDLDVEKNAAKELAAFLDTKRAGDKTLRQTITAENWSKYVNAYLYGGYTLEDIANDLYSRATGKGGGIVHPTINRSEWLAANPQLTGQPAAGVPGAGTGAKADAASGTGTNAGAGAPTVTDIKKGIITDNPAAGGTVNDYTDFNALSAKLAEIHTEIADRTEFYDQQEEIIRNKTGSQAAINRELSKLSQEKNKEMAFLEMRQSIAQGNYDRAREIAKENREALYKDAALKLDFIDKGFVPLSDADTAGLDPTQYIELPDGSKWMKDTTGTALDYFNVDNWAKNILDGSASLGNVPEEQRTAVNNRIKDLIDTGYVSMTPLQKEQLGKLSGELRQEPMYRDMVDISNGYKSVEVGYSFDNGAGDLTMINGFQRMIDPGSVVREGEFANVESASGWLDKFLNLKGKITDGSRMTADARARLKQVADSLYNAKATAYNNMVGTMYKARAEAFNLDYGLIGQDFPVTSVSGDVDSVWEDSGSAPGALYDLDQIWV